ncbi:hypothetical protein, conserved [Trypanosoma brucei brucei TREU927]|uniref:Pentacotripeptide-repeat region of PRORP domain-containing protein n=1 Tax=Trypanosoma brucei brucei (strain 927/4 GUTat10.1) TaxID=185431 RepID=Q384U4_TRYB2|nr:hypothetical protein, conserved [Trypanosoma brucei brucei TREU927]EAN79687.1 hypothetical protein, conserved [Trypanosoma brucei brucei TREU927]
MTSSVTGPPSSFAAAAKVLFDSAKKVGAVKPLGTTSKLYAHQLKKIQSQSRKKGGSLGNVSYNVAEFLEAHRASQVKSSQGPIFHTRCVPLIDIPLKKTKQTGSGMQKTSSNEAPLLNLHKRQPHLAATPDMSKEAVPVGGVAGVGPQVPKLAPPKLDSVLLPKDGEAKRQPWVHHTDTHAADRTSATGGVFLAPERILHGVAPRATVVEEKPLFESPCVTEAKPLSFLDLKARQPMKEVVEVVDRPIKPSVTVPISSGGSSAASTRGGENARTETISVDVWELQRERELEQLRKDQEKAEKERLEARREEEHKTLGDEWVLSRTLATSRPLCVGAVNGALEKLYFSSDWETCFQLFKELVCAPTPPVPSVSKQAVCLMERHLRRVPGARRNELKVALSKELKERKLLDEATRFDLKHTYSEAFLQVYRSASSSVKDSLDLCTTAKAISTLVRSGSWLEAVEVFHRSQQRFSDKGGRLGLGLLAESRSLDGEARTALSEYTSKTLTAQGRFGKLHSIELVKLSKGGQKRHLLSQLIESGHVDEVIYAELLRTTKENVEDVLEEIGKRGLNVEDPAILAALCWRSFDVESPQVLFREIERQEAKIGIRPAHVLAAVAMARASKSEHTLRSTIQILKKKPNFRCKFVLRKLLPLLYERRMNSEIVELAEIYASNLPIAVALPQAVGFINSALIAQGKNPLSTHLASDLNLSGKAVVGDTGDATQLTIPRAPESVASTEAMFQCVKERDWLRALELLGAFSLHSAGDPDVGMRSVMYNCALNASMEKREIVMALYKQMIERGVQVNATTSNALLSCFIGSSEWEESIEFYKRTDSSLRDGGTYSIMLSLFGKNGMWREACEVFQDARVGLAKAPPAIFRLGINAAHSHNWEATLSIFGNFLKAHGIQNISDSVVDKVVRCLSQNNRTTELKKVEMEVSKMKGKNKGKKK